MACLMEKIDNQMNIIIAAIVNKYLCFPSSKRYYYLHQRFMMFIAVDKFTFLHSLRH